MKRHVSRWKTAQQIHLLARFGKALGIWLLGALDSIYPPTMSNEVWQNTSPTLLYMTSDILSMLKRWRPPLQSLYSDNWIRFFPLRVGKTCKTYELKRLRNDLPLYPSVTQCGCNRGTFHYKVSYDINPDIIKLSYKKLSPKHAARRGVAQSRGAIALPYL